MDDYKAILIAMSILSVGSGWLLGWYVGIRGNDAAAIVASLFLIGIGLGLLATIDRDRSPPVDDHE